MTQDSISAAIESGEPAFGSWVAGGGDFTLNPFQRAGYDLVGIDCQHSLLPPTHPVGRASLLGSIAAIGKACDATGVIFGIHVPDAGAATVWRRGGAQLAVVGSDKILLRSAAAVTLQQLTERTR